MATRTSPKHGGRGPTSMAAWATVAGAGWTAGAAWLLVRGVGAKEACSASFGSDELGRCPCDLVGWIWTMAVLGGAAVWMVATVSGAWRGRVASVLALGACAGLPVLGLLALRSVAAA